MAEVDGFLCFISPEVDPGLVVTHSKTNADAVRPLAARADNVVFRWSVREGGGWTHRGGEKVVTLAEGIAFSADTAEKSINEWLDERAERVNR